MEPKQVIKQQQRIKKAKNKKSVNVTSVSWLYFEEHLKRGLKRVRLLLLSAPWFCCGPRLEICSWSLMHGAAWSTGAPCGSAVAFGRCLFMWTLPGTSSPSASPLFLISSPPYRCIAEALCISPPTPPVPISISDLRCFFSLQFFIFFPSSVPEPHNVCHFSSRSFSFLSPLLNIPCRFGLISGPFFFFPFFSEMPPPPYRLWPFRLHFVPIALARMPRGSVSINPQSPALTHTLTHTQINIAHGYCMQTSCVRYKHVIHVSLSSLGSNSKRCFDAAHRKTHTHAHRSRFPPPHFLFLAITRNTRTSHAD